MKINPKKIRRLARVFSLVLDGWHTPAQMKEIVLRNKLETSEGVCHSHDFCDANQAMIDAFEAVYGREPDLQRDDDHTLISYAGAIAKSNGFSIKEMSYE